MYVCMYIYVYIYIYTHTHKMFPALVGVHPLAEDPASPLHRRRRKHGAMRRSTTALGHTSAGGVHGEGVVIRLSSVHGEGEAYENNDHGHTHASMP